MYTSKKGTEYNFYTSKKETEYKLYTSKKETENELFILKKETAYGVSPRRSFTTTTTQFSPQKETYSPSLFQNSC